MIDLLILLDNEKSAQSNFEVEHGLSILIKTSQSTFIFDCGHTNLAWSNAKRLNVDLSKIKFVVLSHSHYDHSGGFKSLMNIVSPPILYTGKNFWREKFSLVDGNYIYKGCGFNQNDLVNWNVQQVICNDILQLDCYSFLIGNINRRYNFESIPKKFLCGDEKLPDDFSDEIVLALRNDDGLAVVTGCGHRGILNIISTVKERLNLPVHSVIGGIHLTGESSDRIKNTLQTLNELGVKNFYFGHCSGVDEFKISVGESIKL